MSDEPKSGRLDKARQQACKPRLRFPEFRNLPEWETNRLGEIFEFHSTANNPRADLSIVGDIFYIHYGDIHTKFYLYVDFLRDSISKITNDLYKNATFLENGDLVVVDASEDMDGIAKAVEVQGLGHGIRAIAGLHTMLLRDSRKKYVDGFRGLLTEIVPVKEQIKRLAVGGKVYAVSKKVISQVLLPLPGHAEQQKLVDCVSSINALIDRQQQKLDILKIHKKALLQQLFPTEGQTLPKVRFPGFSNSQEWKKKTLDEVASYENGKAHEKTITETGKYTVVNSRFISTEGGIRKYSDSGLSVAQKEDILMVLSDVPNGKAIAKCYFVECDDVYTVNQRVCKLKPLKVVSKFLFYALNRNPFLLTFDDRMKQTNLRKDDVLRCPVSIPSQIEQQKIADCLSSVDELITLQMQKLNTLKVYKKGLMQQLFPSIDGVNK